MLGSEVPSSFLASDRTYGGRRVWHDVLASGHACGLYRVGRLMRQQALRARPRRRSLPKDKRERSTNAIAPNVLARQFEADAPSRKWVADFTYIWTAEGWLYVAAVIDLFSRRVVGWSMTSSVTAIWRRGKPDALLHHFDRGALLAVTSCTAADLRCLLLPGKRMRLAPRRDTYADVIR